MPNCILLGDSIFDNGRYTGGGLAVIDHLRACLGGGWGTTLLAVDGSTTADVAAQLSRLPPDATHLVVSAGGNDALLASGLIDQPARSMADALEQLVIVGSAFEASYRKMLRRLAETGRSAFLCTVYYPAFADRFYQKMTVAGLTIFNDVIIRLAVEEGLPLLDLRRVCAEPGDYANEIEPSVAGGKKIAEAIHRALTGHDFARHGTVIYT